MRPDTAAAARLRDCGCDCDHDDDDEDATEGSVSRLELVRHGLGSKRV